MGVGWGRGEGCMEYVGLGVREGCMEYVGVGMRKNGVCGAGGEEGEYGVSEFDLTYTRVYM